MKKIENNKHRTTSMISAYDKWLVAYDILLKKFDELSKTRKVNSDNIKMNLVLSDNGTYCEHFNIALNMSKDNQGIVQNGIQLDFYDINEFLYVASYVIDKYLQTTKQKLVITESDDEYIKLSTDFSNIIIRNFQKYLSYIKTEELFFTEFRNYCNDISNVGEIEFHKQRLRKNKEAKESLINKVTEANIESENDITLTLKK